jgi:hypothetical protein
MTGKNFGLTLVAASLTLDEYGAAVVAGVTALVVAALGVAAGLFCDAGVGVSA